MPLLWHCPVERVSRFLRFPSGRSLMQVWLLGVDVHSLFLYRPGTPVHVSAHAPQSSCEASKLMVTCSGFCWRGFLDRCSFHFQRSLSEGQGGHIDNLGCWTELLLKMRQEANKVVMLDILTASA